MTPDEAKENLGKAIYKKSPGLVRGWSLVKIVDFDPNERTPWGKGSIKYEPLDGPTKRNVHCCLSQIEIYESDGNDQGKRRRTRKKTDSSHSDKTRKRQRKSKGKRRRRS